MIPAKLESMALIADDRGINEVIPYREFFREWFATTLGRALAGEMPFLNPNLEIDHLKVTFRVIEDIFYQPHCYLTPRPITTSTDKRLRYVNYRVLLKRNNMTKLNTDGITLFSVTEQMDRFTDRNIYDALSALYVKNGVQTNRFQVTYTGESANALGPSETYTRLHRHVVGVLVEEDGRAAIHKLLESHYRLVYSGSRSIYLLCKGDEVFGIIGADTRTDTKTVLISVMATSSDCAVILDLLGRGLEEHVGRHAARLELTSEGSICRTQITLPTPKPIKDGLYTHTVGIEPAELLEGWLKSDSRCLLLWGIPGGGKSSFIGQLLAVRGYDNIAICDDSTLYSHPALISTIRNLDDGGIVIFEDSDILLESRAKGNTQMSALLNVVSGVAERDIRFVFLTNIARLNDIDPALLRPGRTYKALEFKPYKAEVVNEVRSLLYMDPIDVTGKSEWTLADIAHHDMEEGVEAPGFGFIRGL